MPATERYVFDVESTLDHARQCLRKAQRAHEKPLNKRRALDHLQDAQTLIKAARDGIRQEDVA